MESHLSGLWVEGRSRLQEEVIRNRVSKCRLRDGTSFTASRD